MQSWYRGWMIVLLTVAFVGLAGPAGAAESDDENDDEEARAGLGVEFGIDSAPQPALLSGLGSLGFSAPITMGVRFPIQVGDGWYLEPRLSGHYTESRSVRATDNESEPASDREAVTSSWSVGGAVQIRHGWEIGESTLGFTGGEVGAGYAETSVDQVPSGLEEGALESREESGTNFSFGPVIGAEHYFSSAFSLGLEAGLLARVRSTRATNNDRSSTNYSLAPRGSIVVRTYF